MRLALLSRSRTAPQRVLVESADLAPTGPVLTNLQVPAKATVGVKASFSVSPRAWNAPPAGLPLWKFGDGTSTTGAQVGHTFGATGMSTVSVAQRDAAGNVSTSSGKVSVGAR